MRINPYHHLCCKGLLSSLLTQRHDFVKNTIAAFAARTHIDVQVEPRKLDPNSRRRVDLKLFIENQTALVDVSFVHPTAPSHLAAAMADSNAPLNRRAQSKASHHQSAANAQQSNLFSFVVESFGALHTDCARLLLLITEAFLNFASARATREFAEEFVNSLSIAIQRGNALAILGGHQKNSFISSRAALRHRD